MMQKVYSALPAPPLRQYVRAYAQREIASPECEIVQPVVASLEPVLTFEFRNPTVIRYRDSVERPAEGAAIVGPHTFHRAHIRLADQIETFAIFFRPSALLRLFRLPLNEFVNASFEARDVLGWKAHELWELLAEQPGFEDRVRVADQYLMQWGGSPGGDCPFLRSAEHLLRGRGAVPVRDLAGGTGVSLRQFERRFLDLFGVAPKLFARIARFQAALDVKVLAPAQAWLEIAHTLGYYDQMHMVRDFWLLSDDSPGRTFEAMRDMRPLALAAADLPLSSTNGGRSDIEFF